MTYVHVEVAKSIRTVAVGKYNKKSAFSGTFFNELRGDIFVN